MPFCTGQGTDDVGGCCHLGNGEICPHYKSGDEVLAWVNAQGWTGAKLTRAQNMAQGVKHSCDIAIQVVAASAQALTNRSYFQSSWRNHPQYVADVRPHWEATEERMGYAPDSFNCPTYQGGGSNEAQDHHPDAPLVCCFGQDDATCEAQATNLHTTAVKLRRAGGF